MKTPSDKQRMEAIASRFKELRIEAGYASHQKFAYDNDLQPKQVWRLESGYEFKISSLFRILKIHKITLEEFFSGLT